MSAASNIPQRPRRLLPNPIRDLIMDAMRTYGRPLSPARLSEITGIDVGLVAYHIRTLHRAGIIKLVDEGRVRGAIEHFYEPVDTDDDPDDLLLSLLKSCGVLTLPDPDGRYPRLVVLDDTSRGQLEDLLDTLRPEVTHIAEEAVKRSAG